MLYVVAEEINNRLGCWISYSSRTNSRLMLIGGARAPPRNWIYLARFGPHCNVPVLYPLESRGRNTSVPTYLLVCTYLPSPRVCVGDLLIPTRTGQRF